MTLSEIIVALENERARARATADAVVARRPDIVDASHDGRRVRYVRESVTADTLAHVLDLLESLASHR